MADENNGNQPEMSPEDKKLHDMLQRELIHYSMTFKESIDNLALKQREETQKLIEQNLTGVVDALLAKNEQNAQAVVGLGMLVASFVILYDAYEGRGRKKPMILGPILPW